jgi:hypothetical protein
MNRQVVTLRLAEVERAQIAAAAGRLKLTLSGFLRQSALQASAVVDEKAAPMRPVRDVTNPRPMRREPLVLVDGESEHWVDGEVDVAPEHWVEGERVSW